MVTQASEEIAAAAASPARAPFETQARANSGIAASAQTGRAPRISQPSASAASGGQAISAR